MDNRRLFPEETKKFKLSKVFYSLFSIFVLAGITSAQNTVWRYVMTFTGGAKTYLNDEQGSAVGKKLRWEKAVKADGSFAVALAEWDCGKKRRLTKQITFYDSDQTVVGTKKTGFGWIPIIPNSTADSLFHRVCSPAAPVMIARITGVRTELGSYPDQTATGTRTVCRGKRFEIMSETERDNWYNVVDVATQEDYWLDGDSFETIRATPKKKSPQPPEFSRCKKSLRRLGGKR